MDWMSKLEKKFGRYAIPNLTLYLVACYAIGYIALSIVPELISYFVLNPELILRGQIWRIVTWIFIPSGGSLFVTLITVYMYYWLGQMLENLWGAFRYNLYIFSGMLFTLIGAFVLYFITGTGILGALFSPYYIYMSLFLACAALVPDMQLYIFFMIPIKIKWLGILEGALFILEIIQGNIAVKIVILASLLNFFIFFLTNKNMKRFHPKQVARRKKFQREIKRPEQHYKGGARHRCAICGRTELDDPNLEFRYCSRCKGDYEYCQDHLFTHEHVK